MHFDLSDIVGCYVNKPGISPPAIIESTIKTADLYIVCMNIPKDPNVFTWTTQTINVFGNKDDIEQIVASLDRKLKGKNLIIVEMLL